MEDINRNQMESLRILWENGALKPAEIQAKFSWSIENATLRSVLALLVARDVLAREKRGKAFYYQAKKSKRSMLSKMTQMMAHFLSNGSVANFTMQLIENEKLSKQDLEELRRVLAEKAPGKPASKDRH
jgi:BlaI family transcriptional regulator, penicillinase repressor